MLAPADASRNRTLSGWRMLAPSDASRNRTGRDQLAAMDARPIGCSALGTGRYQVGSDGCSPHRMLLEAGRYQVGSYGCSRHEMLL